MDPKQDKETARKGKELAAKAAAQLVESDRVVGLGTGSTAEFLIRELGRRVREEGLRIEGVPTSFEALRLAREVGISVRSVDAVDTVHIAVDGADRVDPGKNLIKGGGGCHTMEKIVEAYAERLVIIADASKLVESLGGTFPVPIEVVPAALRGVMSAVERLGGTPKLRMAEKKVGPVVTDLGNMLVDAFFESIPDPGELEKKLNNLAGVVDNGLFVGLAHEVIIGDGATGTIRHLK